jgi:hypothetical protein
MHLNYFIYIYMYKKDTNISEYTREFYASHI